MKKKVGKILLLVLGIILAGLLIWNLTDCATVSIDGQTAKVSFADSWKLRTALIPKEIHFDGAGCHFTPTMPSGLAALHTALQQTVVKRFGSRN